MSKIFVSCGQFTTEEKNLGKAIVELTRSITGIEPFFAEQVQDLNGLESNILAALRDCVGFITVLHPRGEITRPNGTQFVRASVWIEQEIAIATYIQLVEKRTIPVIAFIHESVGREGIRDLLHLNPIPFTREADVLEALPALLRTWTTASPAGVRLTMEAGGKRVEQGHRIRELRVHLINDSNNRIENYNGQLCFPSGMLRHWSTTYAGEFQSPDPNYRCFRFSEQGRGTISPHNSMLLFMIQYCFECGVIDTRDDPKIGSILVSEYRPEAKLWLAGRQYSAASTIGELEKDAGQRGQ
jgi:hypothetical protein